MVATLERPGAARGAEVPTAPRAQLPRSYTWDGANALSSIMPSVPTDNRPYGFQRLLFRFFDAWVGTISTGALAARPGPNESRTELYSRPGMRTGEVTLLSPTYPRLGSALAHLEDEIEASRSMLELEDDWDGEGSPGYDVVTWQRAVDFLTKNASRLNEEYGGVIQSPRIRKGPQGSIDLHWRAPNRELLVNIPAVYGAPADYYGDDGTGGQQIKGTLDPERQGYHLMLWLVT